MMSSIRSAGLSAILVFCGTGMPQAQDMPAQCAEFLETILADHPGDFRSCPVEVADYTFETCEPPQTFNSALPTTHLLLAIDASGSMAGQTGGESKMEAAKREALAFLSDIPAEVEVGLIVYGHRGNNTEAGKAESCAASELVHSFETSRRDLNASIAGLSPTGWTPMGGALEFAADLVADLPPQENGPTLAPVVYMISDGEETCDGDPVAAAKALFEAGVRTTVNTIGFAVDAETSAQLEAIAEAGGGVYYPAETANALRAQLDAIREAEGSLARYEYCVAQNAARIAGVYHNARVALTGCYRRNNPTTRQTAVLGAVRAAVRDERPEAACAEILTDHALYGMDDGRGWLNEQVEPLISEPLTLIDTYRREAELAVLGAAD